MNALIRYYTYYLALQKCNTHSNYTIHGLWIDYTRGGYPQFCGHTPFELDKLNNMVSEMKRVWPSCYGDDGVGLWEHEWKKHGTCFPGTPSIVEYFNKTLELYKFHEHYFYKICTRKDCMIPVDVYF
jgi:ribonuclease I